MKKLLTAVVTAAVVTMSAAVPVANVSAGFVIEQDAQTAMEKNRDAILEALENTEITNDFTREDLENIIFENCDYSADKYAGAAYEIYEYKLMKATGAKEGSLSAEVLLSQDGGEVIFSVRKTIAKLEGVTEEPEEEEMPEDTEKRDASNLSAADIKKQIEAAKKAISDAIWDFEVSNDTTRKDILQMARDALPEGSAVSVTLESDDFSMVKASTTVNGTVYATLTLTCGDSAARCSVAKTLQPIVTGESVKIDEDRSLISKAVDAIDYTNRITKEEMLQVAKAAVKNGSKVEWKGNFVKKESTLEAEGEVSGSMVMTLGSETRETWFQIKIPQLLGKRPSISVDKEEWEILARTNIERAKTGAQLLGMVSSLQDACNIREKEMHEKFSHTRPDGTNFSTAISAGFKAAGFGENLASCTPGHQNPERAITTWMDSPGHRANILNQNYTYMGVGEDGTYAIQIFAIGKNPIVSFTTSAGTTHFADKYEMMKEYAICKTADGTESYLPLNVKYMTEVDGGYQMKLNSSVPVIFTIGDGTAETGTQQTVSAPSFSDVAAGAYYEAAVKWAVEKQITTGTSATKFSPDNTCTRAQILTFLWRAVGSPKATAGNPFADVKESDYYYDAAVWANEKGMVSGTTFGADTPCTRASTVTYLWLNAGAPWTDSEIEFADVDMDAEYAEAVAWAVEEGVTSGTSATTFSPENICSRGQIVTFLNRALD